MDHNSNLPPGWAMPGDQENRVNEMLNKKSIFPENELENALTDIARDIAILEPNPCDWEGWVTYILEQLETEAQRRRIHVAYEEMVKSLSMSISSKVG